MASEPMRRANGGEWRVMVLCCASYRECAEGLGERFNVGRRFRREGTHGHGVSAWLQHGRCNLAVCSEPRGWPPLSCPKRTREHPQRSRRSGSHARGTDRFRSAAHLLGGQSGQKAGTRRDDGALASPWQWPRRPTSYSGHVVDRSAGGLAKGGSFLARRPRDQAANSPSRCTTRDRNAAARSLDKRSSSGVVQNPRRPICSGAPTSDRGGGFGSRTAAVLRHLPRDHPFFSKRIRLARTAETGPGLICQSAAPIRTADLDGSLHLGSRACDGLRRAGSNGDR
jgi:hypothetical protein